MEGIKTMPEQVGPIAVVLAVLVLAASSSVLGARSRKRRGGFPSPPGALPLLGHALSLSDTGAFFATLSAWARRLGGDRGAYEFSLLGARWVVLCGAASVAEAMALRPHRIVRARALSAAASSLGVDGVFNAEGACWSSDRRIVAPALNARSVGDYFSRMKLVAGRLVGKWRREAGCGEAVAAQTDAARYSLDVLAWTILDMDFDTLGDPDHELARDVQDYSDLVFLRSLSLVPYWKVWNNLDGGKDKTEKVVGMIRKRIEDCRKRKNEEAGANGEAREQGRGTRTFLQKIIDISEGQKAKLDDHRAIGNITTMIVAGKDTRSSALSVCLWEIANDAPLQDELFREIAASGMNAETLTLDAVSNGLPRLRSFLYEVLRFKGPTPYLLFEVAEPVEVRGEALAPGTVVVVMTGAGAGEQPACVPAGPHGEGPGQFCPRRWLVRGEGGALTAAAPPLDGRDGYMPFGHGVRACPGARMGIADVTTVLFCVLHAFKLAPAEGHPPVRLISSMAQTYDRETMLVLKPRD